MDYDVKVVAGQLLLLSKSLAPGHKEDVVQSLLFAQLYANSRADKFCQALEWDKYQVKALQEARWITTLVQTRSNQPSPRQVMSVSRLLTLQLGSVLEEGASVRLDAVSRALTALARTPVARQVFDEACLMRTAMCVTEDSAPASRVSLQVTLVEPGALAVSIQIGFTTRVAFADDLLTRRFSGLDVDGAVVTSVTRTELDIPNYARVRSKILTALGTQQETLVVEVGVPLVSAEWAGRSET
ncbi:hypothetical protein [Pseudomonas sp. D1HM]|uniref:hypothetical protein n=1 Tax=Pseudomonas sp. D1HM TaxID=1784816 RepID=UPI001C4E5DA5|nr:hypothetical protein [Pseudomonas sp. D1HM]MBW0237449.1 hypothetical protein [Pseudomonas sp. D1HM]